MLDKFQPIKMDNCFYWLYAFLAKSNSMLTENVLNQWKITKILQIAGYSGITIQVIIKISEFKIIRIFQS